MNDGAQMNSMHLFAGGGGGLLADLILGHTPIVAVEWDTYACKILRERISDGWFKELSVFEGDVRLFDPSEYAGRVDCIHAGFPCQDISLAGKQSGIGEGTRSGLYREVIRIASIVRPRHIFLENVAAITSKSKGYLEIICKDLYEIGYDCRWTTLSASEVGAPHKRDRWWLLAHSKRDKQSREEPCVREAGRMGRIGEQMAWNRDWESALHEFRRMDVRTPYQVDRTDIIRNAQVPLQAAVAYSILEEMFNDM